MKRLVGVVALPMVMLGSVGCSSQEETVNCSGLVAQYNLIVVNAEQDYIGGSLTPDRQQQNIAALTEIGQEVATGCSREDSEELLRLALRMGRVSQGMGFG